MNETILIPDFAGQSYESARSFCTNSKVSLAVEGGVPGQNPPSHAIVERNGSASKPGTSVMVGGTVSVILFPLEPRQRHRR